MNLKCLFGHKWKYCIEVAKYNPDKDIDQFITNVPMEIISAMQKPKQICVRCRKIKEAKIESPASDEG